MISSFSRDSRRKAVWGPKRTSGAALLLLVGLAPSAAAAGTHNRQAPNAKAASPNAFTTHNKLDRRLADRSVNGPSNETTPVVVTFTDGQLPAEHAVGKPEGRAVPRRSSAEQAEPAHVAHDRRSRDSNRHGRDGRRRR